MKQNWLPNLEAVKEQIPPLVLRIRGFVPHGANFRKIMPRLG